MPDPSPIDLAVRAYPEIPGRKREPKNRKPARRSNSMLVFDTETRTDATQSLMFGCFRFIVDGLCVREALFHAKDLSEAELSKLEKYALSHRANVVRHGRRSLDLLTLDEFLNELFRISYKARGLVVGFNIPFDLSRVGFDVAPARGYYSGGFSLGIWSYAKDLRNRNRFRPRVAVKHIDSKRALMGFTARLGPDELDLQAEDGSGKKRTFQGRFLDLRTLAFALTDRSHSLKSACIAFGVEHGKTEIAEHGKITDQYVDYCRRDVEASCELAAILLKEFDQHPIQLQETRTYSPASIGKAYLRAMGVSPVLDRHKSLQPFVSYAQSAFFGGRTSAHIRKAPVPVVYTDFLSMYPTVNGLMGIWSLVTANEIRVREHCKEEIISWLECITLDDLFNPNTWKNLIAFVRIQPDGDVLPTRGQYNPETKDWQVAINHLYSDKVDDALWFSLPDAVASFILTGRVPKIIDAFVLESHGTLTSLRTTKLRGNIEVDPTEQDFFKVAIEERKRLSKRTAISEVERERLDKALKVLANSTSYGIYAEMNREESNERIQVQCQRLDGTAFPCKVLHPDIPGEFCFPPIASLITGAARLMLALLEKCVTDLGGTYAMEDTDSMAIVATQRGGLLECPGGPHWTKSGKTVINALSWKEVAAISARFRSLNPYDKEAVPGSILKIEEDNFDFKTGKQRQLWCLAISAKRYALFVRDRNGVPSLLRKGTNSKENHWSEHGLGHLLNPTDPNSEDREWIAAVWADILFPTKTKSQRVRPFQQTPAVGRVNVTSPAIMKVLKDFNANKVYVQQIKPFNFLLSCHVRPLGHPVGVDPTRFHLIAPYEINPAMWTKMNWIDQYTGKQFLISVSGNYSTRQTARVKTFADVIADYAFHAESKCANAQGAVSGRDTLGLLQRRHVKIDRVRFIGKESNELEEVDAGMVHSLQDVYTEYVDPTRDEWEIKIRPAIAKEKVSISKLHNETGFSSRTLKNWRTGKSRPHAQNQKTLSDALRRLGLFT